MFTREEYSYKRFAKISLMIGVLGVLGFVGFNLYPLIHGPSITVETLSDGATLNDSMIRLSGRAKFTKDLSINGAPLATSPSGTFDEHLVLNPGYNLITITGTDRFGTVKESTYTLVLHEEKPTLTLK
jgi:hypothetical protein